MFVVCGTKSEVLISVVVYDQSSIMADEESSSLEVRVFMTENEVLWYEFEHGVSQQGSSSESNPFLDVPSARVLSNSRARPSG